MKNTSYRSQFSAPASTSAVPASAALPASAPPLYLYLIALNRDKFQSVVVMSRHTTPYGGEGLSTDYPKNLNSRRIHQSLIPPYNGSQPTRYSLWWGRAINGRPNKIKLAVDTSKLDPSTQWISSDPPRHDNKTHTRGCLPKPNPIWRVFPTLIGFGYGFGFSPISKHRYGTRNRDICIHPEPIPKLVLNVENQ
ncbi:hypothetical protein MTR_8g039520 [Medicago truncatula]|uniref:Uncharacterized protein n=1 Tax=Medicago truncatula TaxID=3880 RepID=G7LGR7_MEDTR|nr:hypothetical protein MTR_8g039520 [Medicago truncatula]